MKFEYNPRYPSVEDLRKKARARIPGFAFDYLDGGCNEEINLIKNTSEIRKIELMPEYLKKYSGIDMKTELFGHMYDAPFGISPIGLQGLIWPNSPEILAKAAFDHNIPFILSTVSTSSIERISEITEGKAWFQLYHPADNGLRDQILQRADAAHCPVLVILSDVPSFGYRAKEIRNGLAMPPRMTMKNVLQILSRPNWAFKTLMHGQPSFQTLRPYIPKGMNMHHLGLFMNKTFDGRLNSEKVAEIRNKWKGKLVLKGIVNEADVVKAMQLGIDGIIVSNHGGRQLDAGESAIKSLFRIAENYRDKIKIMMDSGLRSGPDIARALASGATFTFLGRSFMYGAAALGKQGGNHTVAILKTQLQQVMQQICCERVEDLPNHLITNISQL
ncbi:alpha-hydroxy-acid oxidizing protein [Ginsengibacter hankyongi]|uniref:Alpha-hydroxy-acid oxidizing protein n=1 Tax=Ginsengibacter hankyongi TaxID=2607284 RepID=A0A5J5IAN2_9BACT|nr:alpha-hydroxy acid oxidase [Ginsengibacter hankyongi]KAA9035646.1 alpha-hydroxy-acid oxidizing protein [Ginsengibacter hankyongi]